MVNALQLSISCRYIVTCTKNTKKKHLKLFLLTLVLCSRSLSIAQVVTSWRVGSKRKILIFLILIMCTLGAFLGDIRMQGGTKALFLDNLDTGIFNVYCVNCWHRHIYSISLLCVVVISSFCKVYAHSISFYF